VEQGSERRICTQRRGVTPQTFRKTMVGVDAVRWQNAEEWRGRGQKLSVKGKAFYQSSRAFRHALIEGSSRAMADKTS
jgi:hypothetical protein